MDLQDRLTEAIAAHRQGELDAAEAAYRAVLDEAPAQPDALHFLGLVEFQRGAPERGIALVERSVAAHPANAAAHNNLGNMLKSLGRREEALKAYAAALGIDDSHADTWNNVGVLLRAAERMHEAAEVLGRAVQVAPDHAEAWHNLGTVLLLSGRLEEAAVAFESCLDLGTQRWSDPAWHARVLCALGRRERAIAHLEEFLARHPGHAVATYQLAAILGEAPARASDGYVRDHFDGFADDFDDVLRALGYRAPQLVADAVAQRIGDAGPLADVVDLGCGTGLCGPLIREHCGQLTGVDLSSGMLRHAARREVYDHLVEYELVKFLRDALPIRFDLAVCVDTLCYFGALEPLMAALAPALKPGGGLIATVELLDEPGPGYRIDQSGRYAHRKEYIAAAARDAGLTFRGAEHAVLRRELGKDVPGLVFELELPGS